MSEDNWKHRSEHMRCGSCMYFVEKVVIPTDPRLPSSMVETEQRPIGRCRRHAPTMGGFPVVFKRDWCGDHKLDEAKV